MLSVIIPANNEEAYLGACLTALLAQEDPEGRLAGTEIVVVANACTDRTVAIARGFAAEAAARGWALTVLDLAEGGKRGALDAGDAAAKHPMRAYVDADIVMGPALLAGIAAALDRPEAAYASGRLEVAPARSWVTRAYARAWVRVPFMAEGVPGAGVFAVNGPGRARWGAWPAIISDDTFARVNFAPSERHLVDAAYTWPMVEGFANLVKVRRRQDRGVAEIAELYPERLANEAKPRWTLARLLGILAHTPLGLGVYLAVALAVKLGPKPAAWTRGR